MIFDTHMHCRYSIDSKMNIDEAKAAAEKLGIGMIITEHWDEDYPTNPEAFVFDIGDYFARKPLFLILAIILPGAGRTAAKNCCWALKWACRKARPPMTTRSAKNTRLILFWVPCIA